MSLDGTKKASWLDSIPASLRHLILLVISGLLAWASIDLPNWHLPTQVGLLIGVAITYAVAWVTPLTRQYGVGADVPTPVGDTPLPPAIG